MSPEESDAAELVFTNRVRQVVASELASEKKKLKLITVSFLLGLSLFIGAGLAWKENILQPIAEYIYPATVIYPKVKKQFLNDTGFANTLLNDDRKANIVGFLAKSKNIDIKLDNLPTVRSEVSDTIVNKIKEDKSVEERIWETIQNGNKEEFTRLVESEFGEALIDQFYYQMTMAFETYNPLDKEKLKEAILRKGKIELPSSIRTLHPSYQGGESSCPGKLIDHSSLQAVLVIPKAASKKAYKWLKCASVKYPQLYLEVRIGKTRLSGIELVGVERTGEANTLDLRVTQEVVKEFRLPNWEKYLSRANGYFKVNSAEFD